MSGKTDPQIVREYLALVESDDPSHLPAVLAHLERELAAPRPRSPPTARPARGCPRSYRRSRPMTVSICHVLTGNIAPNAVVKLAAFGLEKWLDLESGAYGSDHEDRRALVPIALERLASLRGLRSVAGGDVGGRGHAPGLRMRRGRRRTLPAGRHR